MADLIPPGQIVLLHGVPRAGKSSILNVIQEQLDGPWMNLGFDTFVFHVRPKHYLPGGKYERLGPHFWEDDPEDGKRHVLGQHSASLMAGLYESIAAHSRLGFNVVADVIHPAVSHHYIFDDAVRRLAGLPVLFVGVRCPLETIVERRRQFAPGRASSTGDQPVPSIAIWWDREIHAGKTYDIEVNTSYMSPEECVQRIRSHLEQSTQEHSIFASLAARMAR